jgi:hypothetical protein
LGFLFGCMLNDYNQSTRLQYRTRLCASKPFKMSGVSCACACTCMAQTQSVYSFNIRPQNPSSEFIERKMPIPCTYKLRMPVYPPVYTSCAYLYVLIAHACMSTCMCWLCTPSSYCRPGVQLSHQGTRSLVNSHVKAGNPS